MKVDGAGAADDGDACEGHYRTHPPCIVDDLHEANCQRDGETSQGVAGVVRRLRHLARRCLEEHLVRWWSGLELELFVVGIFSCFRE